MDSIIFFVEGEDDANFIKDYLNHLGLYSKDNHFFIPIMGWNKLASVDNKFKENTLSNGTNVILFDADEDFSGRQSQVKEIIAQKGMETKLFLFPNNQEPGSLDELLLNMVNSLKSDILKCFDSYCLCLERNPEYGIPGIKEKIYAYLQANNAKCKIGKRNYQDLTIWNLDHDVLKPLKDFLVRIFNPFVG